MTPDFALFLSFAGIRLLHRHPEGWMPVGEVPLDSRDLAGDLAALRRAGLALGHAWRGTKLLLPEQQVRTLSLDDPDAGPEAARAALDGATPYAVDDLVIDYVSDGRRTHVAAVARETLEEAEAFAAEHGFQPLSFAARPATGFPGEAFFGPSGRAAVLLGGEPVTREDPVLPLLSAGSEVLDDTPQIARASKEAPPPVATAAQAVPEARPAPVEPPPAEVEPPARAAPDAAPDEPAMPVPVVAPVVAPAAAPKPAATPRPKAGTPLSATGGSEPAFAARALPGERRETGAPEPADRQPPGASRVEPRLGPSARPAMPPGATPLAAPTASPRQGSSAPPARARAALPRQEPRVAGKAPPAAASAPEASALQAPRREPEPAAEPARRADPGTRKAPARVGGKPRHLGLILTIVLLVVMGAVWAWAASSDQGFAGLLRRESAPATEVAAAPAVEDSAPREPALRDLAAVAPTVPEPEQAAPETPAVPQPEAAPQALAATTPDIDAAAATVAAAIAALPPTPAEEGTEGLERHAATGVWVEPPRRLASPEAEAAPAAEPAPEAADPVRPAVLPTLAALNPDAAPAAPEPPPAAPVPEPTAPVIAGRPALVPPTRPGDDDATDEASAWVNAMAASPGKGPRLRPDDLVPADAALAAAPAAATGATPPLRPDAPEDLLAALTPGAEPLPGAVAATALADPALAGALAFAPVGLPGAPVAAPGGVSLAGLRPNARPEGLAPETPEPEELAAWDGVRPGLRPEGLAPEEAPSPEVDEAVAEALETPEAPEAPRQPSIETTLAAIVANSPDPLAGATRQAVPSARRPDSRPANFGRVVATQLDRLARASAPRAAPAAPRAQASAQRPAAGNLQPNERAESEPEAASSAAAAPSGPTAASVAQAATLSDAMALREMNLIGVYGQPSDRRALVRMGNGRYIRVSVGDSLDGGQVTAIGDNALNYVKRGRTYALVIPGG